MCRQLPDVWRYIVVLCWSSRAEIPHECRVSAWSMRATIPSRHAHYALVESETPATLVPIHSQMATRARGVPCQEGFTRGSSTNTTGTLVTALQLHGDEVRPEGWLEMSPGPGKAAERCFDAAGSALCRSPPLHGCCLPPMRGASRHAGERRSHEMSGVRSCLDRRTADRPQSCVRESQIDRPAATSGALRVRCPRHSESPSPRLPPFPD